MGAGRADVHDGLILSELVTNAIRYGGETVHVRVLRDRSLICEVFDSSSTSPHLRYAAMTDEGRARAVPRRAAGGALGHPLYAGGQGHLGGATGVS